MKSVIFIGKYKSRTVVANILFVISLLIPNLVLSFTEDYTAWSRLAGIMIPLGFYILWTTLSRRAGFMVWMSLPFVILAAFQLVLLYLFGGSIISSNMFTNLLTTNSSEASELLGNIYPAIILVCVIYVPQLWFASLEIAHKNRIHPAYRLRAKSIGSISLFVGILSLIPAYLFSDRHHPLRNDIFPANVLYNAQLSAMEFRQIANFDKTSNNFSHNAIRDRALPEREIYVYIIGEASRANNWQLFGYGRETNPRLSRRNDVILFDNMLTQSNTTHKSVPTMLSSASISDHKQIYNRRGLPALFNEIGFRTCFISNQSPNRAMIDNLASDADIAIYVQSPRYDMQLFEQMQRQIERFPNDDMLIILHCYGSHFSYHQRYPRNFAKFLPDDEVTISCEKIKELTNAYDNSIIYTDHMIASTIEFLESMDNCCSAVIYCADHGEDLYDDGRERFLHSSPTTTYYQLHVAALAWFSKPYRKLFPEKYKAAVDNAHSPATTRSMFHTIAEMASIQSRYIDDKLSLVNSQFDTLRVRYYLNDHNEAVSFLSLGLSDEDIRLFSNRGICLE